MTCELTVFWESVSPRTVYVATHAFLLPWFFLDRCPLCYRHLSGVCRGKARQSACMHGVPIPMRAHIHTAAKYTYTTTQQALTSLDYDPDYIVSLPYVVVRITYNPLQLEDKSQWRKEAF